MIALLRVARKAARSAIRLVPNRLPAVRLALAIPAAVLVAGCEPVNVGSGFGSGPSVDTSQPVPVALLVPRGSGQAGDELVARSLENAARLAAADLNGAEIDLRVYATGGNPAQAQQVASQAIAEGASIILGPLYAESANAVGLAAAQAGVNVLAFTNNPTVAGGNVFVLGATFENTADRLTGFAARQGRERIVIVRSNNLSGQLGAQAIRSAAQNNGAQITDEVVYEFSQPGVVGAVPRVQAAVEGSQADAIFLTSNTAGALPMLAQMLPERGVNPAVTQYIGLSRWDIPSDTLSLPGVQGGWFAVPDPGPAAQFAGRYQSAYGEPPHPLAGLAYDGVAAIGALISRGGSNALSAQALRRGSGFQGVNGVFRFKPDGTNERGLAVATVRNGQVVILDPAPRGFGGFGF